MSDMRQRAFVTQQLSNLLLVLRVFTISYISLEIFLLIIAASLILQYLKDGFTPLLIPYLIFLGLQVGG